MLIVHWTVKESPLPTVIAVKFCLANKPFVAATVSLNNPDSATWTDDPLLVNVFANTIVAALFPAVPEEFVHVLVVATPLANPEPVSSAPNATSVPLALVVDVPTAITSNGVVSAPVHTVVPVPEPAPAWNKDFETQFSPLLTMTLSLCRYYFTFPTESVRIVVTWPVMYAPVAPIVFATGTAFTLINPDTLAVNSPATTTKATPRNRVLLSDFITYQI